MGNELHFLLANGLHEISVVFGGFVPSEAHPDPGCSLWLGIRWLGNSGKVWMLSS